MIFPIFSYHCKRCGYSQYTVFTSSYIYVYLDGDQIPLLSQTGWCCDCDSIQDIEDLSITPRLELLRNLQRKMASIQKKNWPFISRLTYDAREWADDPEWRENLSIDTIYRWSNQIEEVIKGIDLIQKRKSPPRCLSCGTTNINSVFPPQTASKSEPDSSRSLIHPVCGGELELHPEYDIFVNGSHLIREYSTEGKFIRRCKEPHTRLSEDPEFRDGGRLIRWIRKLTE